MKSINLNKKTAMLYTLVKILTRMVSHNILINCFNFSLVLSNLLHSFPDGSIVESPVNAGGTQVRARSEESPRERNDNPLPVFLPGKSTERSVVGYSESMGSQRFEHISAAEQQ